MQVSIVSPVIIQYRSALAASGYYGIVNPIYRRHGV